MLLMHPKLPFVEHLEVILFGVSFVRLTYNYHLSFFQIPAVRQFGIFMGLVVLFCFLQVILVIPHVIYIWDCIIVKIENFCFSPVYRVIYRFRRVNTSVLPDVRMSTLARNDSDSGIDTVSTTNSDNISNSSSQSDPNAVEPSEDVDLLIPEEPDDNETPEAPPPVVQSTPEMRLTILMQKVMFCISVIPMSMHFIANKISLKKPHFSVLVVIFHIFLRVLILLAVLGTSVGLLLQLRFSDKPPQFFDPDSNIQKMLDLAGNVTDSSAINCYNCSAWNSGYQCRFTAE